MFVAERWLEVDWVVEMLPVTRGARSEVVRGSERSSRVAVHAC